jgi:hypothetical protein
MTPACDSTELIEVRQARRNDEWAVTFYQQVKQFDI